MCYGNADAAVYPAEPDAIRRTLAEHLAAPVRFADQIEAMYADGVRTFIEVGAGSALTGLIGAILGDRDHVAVSLDKRGRDGVTAWHEAVGRLALRGVPMDLAKLSQDRQPAPPAAEPRMSVRINGTGYTPPTAHTPHSVPRQAPAPPAHGASAANAFRAAAGAAGGAAVGAPCPAPAPTLLEPAAPMTESDPTAQWLAAVQEMQRQTAEAHMHFQRVLADSHQAFLQLAENTFAAFTGQPPPLPPQQVPALVPGPRHRPMPPAPVPMPPAPQPQAVPPPVRTAGPATAPSRAAATGSAAATEPVSLALLLSVVADKTGYPVDMLNGAMDLETDLGIDSIKKVEIFAAVRQRAEDLPATDSRRWLSSSRRARSTKSSAGPRRQHGAGRRQNHQRRAESTRGGPPNGGSADRRSGVRAGDGGSGGRADHRRQRRQRTRAGRGRAARRAWYRGHSRGPARAAMRGA